MAQPTIGESGEKPFWLKDNFAPVFDEVTETHLEVTGAIPPELRGRFFRNGSNPKTGFSTLPPRRVVRRSSWLV